MTVRVADAPRQQPQDREAEQAVLGAVLLDNLALARALEILSAEDFYDQRCARIFQAMCELAERSEPIDHLTLADMLESSADLMRVGGRAAIAELLTAAASAANILHHARIVRDCAMLRQVIRVAADLQERAYRKEPAQDVVMDAERALYQIGHSRETGSWVPLAKVAVETVDYVQRACKQGRETAGIPTGYSDVDRLLGGWQNSDLIIVAARPSMGKTAFALCTGLAAVKAGYRVGFASLEMSRLQLGLRLHAMQAPIDVHSLRTGRVTPEGWARLASTAQELEQCPLWVDDTAMLTVEHLQAKARLLKAGHGLDLLIVDYLQLLHMPKAETRQQGIAEASRQLKLLAKELNIPVIALSQVSRACEARQNRRPVLADLRDSGAIEQDADVVIFLYRDEVYAVGADENGAATCEKGIAEVMVRKHRNGPIGDARLAFIEQYASFADLAPGYQATSLTGQRARGRGHRQDEQ